MAATLGLTHRRYTDPENFRREREVVLLPSWQWVGHDSDLPASGTALRVDFAGRSAFVLRGGDGFLRAFRNVCSHRGSRLVDGDPHTGLAFCVEARVRCPYHAWVYDERGALVQVPGEDSAAGLDRAALGLRPIPVASWRGWVFIAFEPPSRPLASLLAPLDAELQAYQFETMRRAVEPRLRPCRADWKAIGEHLLDVLHLDLARPGLKARIGSDPAIEVRSDDVAVLTSTVSGGDSPSWSQRAYSSVLPQLEELPAERRRLWGRYYLWPNLAFEITPDQLTVLQVLPSLAGESMLRSATYATPNGSRGMRLARYLNTRVRRHAAAQDLRLLERRQAGLAMGEHDGGALSDAETGVRWFTARLRAALPDEEARPATPRRRPGLRRAT